MLWFIFFKMHKISDFVFKKTKTKRYFLNCCNMLIMKLINGVTKKTNNLKFSVIQKNYNTKADQFLTQIIQIKIENNSKIFKLS